MPVYPVTTQSPQVTSTYSPHLKSTLLALTLTLLISGCWYIFAYISQPFFNLSAWISPNQTSWLNLALLLILQGFLVTLISLTALLINNFPLKLLPLFGSPMAVYPFYSHNLQLASLIILTLGLTQVVFSLHVNNNLGLFKRFSLSPLILPPLSYLFLGTSFLLALPIYFQLRNQPQVVTTIIHQRLVEPIIDNLIQSELTNSDLPLDPSRPPITPVPLIPSDSSSLVDSLSTSFQGLLPSQLLAQLQKFQSPKSSINLETDTSPVANKYPPIFEDIRTETISKFDSYINPITPYIPYILPLIIFFITFQLLSLVRPVFLPLVWLLFQLALAFRVARITTREEPVEVLEV